MAQNISLSDAKSIIAKRKWYWQSAAARHLTFSYPWEACYKMTVLGKRMNLKLETAGLIHNSYLDLFLSKESLKKISDFYLNRQLRDKKFIYKIIKNLQIYLDDYFEMCDRILYERIHNLTNSDLYNLINKFNKLYVKVWSELIFIDSFDLWSPEILKTALKEQRLKPTKEEIDYLLIPPKASILLSEYFDLKNIAEKFRTKQSRNSKDFEEALEQHSRKYYWLNNDYVNVEYLDASHFKKRIGQMSNPKKYFKSEIENAKLLKNLRNNKDKILKKYRLSKRFAGIAEFFAILGNLRDERKAYNQRSINVVQKLAKEMGKRFKISGRLIENLNFWELQMLFKNPNRAIGLAKKRYQGPFWIGIKSAEDLSFYGDTAFKLDAHIKQLITKESSLQGQVAYSGMVKGRAHIIWTKTDFSKFKRGEILVTPNTRPEFVPIMKLAKGIITQEGGLTSHAAIVSRELRIPCIVGVQSAMRAIKNGDLIELDAVNGIIKKIR